MTARTQRILLAVITSIGLLRGLWWVVATPVWSPIDEQAHYDFVESIARGDGIPIVGKTRAHPDVLEVARTSSRSQWRNRTVPQVVHESYEAAQPPLYYAVMAPVWRAFDGASPTVRVYALRVASLLLSLLLIPLVWLLGRTLDPDEPHVGVVAAALVVAFSGVNGNFAIVANDGLMTVFAAATLLVVARAIRDGLTPRRAGITGALVGATVLTKTTGLAVVFVVALGALVAVRANGQRLADLARFGAITGAVAGLLVAPWVAFNLAHYSGLTASKQLDAITGSLQSDPPFNLHGLATRLRQAGHGFFDAQLLSIKMTNGARLWFGATAALGIGALARLWRARTRGDAVVLAWLLAAWPIAFVTMALFILQLSGGRSDIAGRHLYVALPAVAVAVAFAAQRVFGRAVFVAIAAVVAIGLTFEAADAARFARLVDAPLAFAPRLWAVLAWAFFAAALSITRWGKRETGRSA